MPNSDLPAVLAVDDAEINLEILNEILKEDYKVFNRK
jgi:hypothetical protein